MGDTAAALLGVNMHLRDRLGYGYNWNTPTARGLTQSCACHHRRRRRIAFGLCYFLGSYAVYSLEILTEQSRKVGYLCGVGCRVFVGSPAATLYPCRLTAY